MERRTFIAATTLIPTLVAGQAAATRTEAEDQRHIDVLMALADRTGLSMDVWHDWTRGIELGAIEKVLVNVEAGLTRATPTDSHPEWLSQWREVRADWIKAAGEDMTGDSNTPECNEAMDREYSLADLIVGTAARTQQGCKAQVSFLIADQRDNLKGEYGEGFLASIRDGLEVT